ncbi:hypothetical protein L873DRAFT_565213 [Choiromyces venosus 120613-1]|uniref:Uncharacterized protein n=1 Tax=Choiromyces venosus 120613-1 TaxID=1336337 RepID=A0A3N4JUB5_9PEZI|nr:hypothetical protein L873DRAFT_565213 [Choiromyces venosus 120613-1]
MCYAETHIIENPLSFRKIAFVSTEDPQVIRDAKNTSSLLSLLTDKSWEWYWSSIPRANSGPETQLKLFGNRTELTIKWLLQLAMALETDAYVGTRGSGWNRLTDGLRCTWFPNCQKPFLEVGDDKS